MEKIDVREDILENARKLTGGQKPLALTAVAWNIKDKQTMLKSAGQAALSGAVGLPAPLLVKGPNVMGEVALITLDEENIYVTKVGTIPLSGAKNSATLTPSILDAALTANLGDETIKFALNEFGSNPNHGLEYDINSNIHTLIGANDKSLCMDITKQIYYLNSLSDIKYLVNNRGEVLPEDVVSLIRGGNEEWIRRFENINNNYEHLNRFLRFLPLDYELITTIIRKFPTFKDTILETLYRAASVASIPKIVPLICIIIGAVMALLGVINIFARDSNYGLIFGYDIWWCAPIGALLAFSSGFIYIVITSYYSSFDMRRRILEFTVPEQVDP